MNYTDINKLIKNIKYVFGDSHKDIFKFIDDIKGEIVIMPSQWSDVDKKYAIVPLNTHKKVKKFKKKLSLFQIQISPDVVYKEYVLALALGELFMYQNILDKKKWNARVKGGVPFVKIWSAGLNNIHYFARVFLMPVHEFTLVINDYTKDGYADLEKVAEFFNVPSGIATLRGRELRLLVW